MSRTGRSAAVHSQPMTRSGRHVSPRLFGRDDLLALGGRRLAEVRAGGGGLLFLAGEAGIGKTRLLRAIEDRASVAQLTVARGGTYPRDLEVGGAVFLDFARSLTRVPTQAELGRSLLDRLSAPDEGPGDGNQRRRLLTLEVADAIASLGTSGPALVSLEDLHWADDLSLEILAALAGRVQGVPLLVVATFRSDELYPRIPMRTWRARLLNARLAEEARLARLSLEDTEALTHTLLGGELPPAHDLVTAIHDRSDGIPLHVEELVGSLAASAGPRPGGPRATDVPETIDAAILDRFGQLSPRARAIAEAGAVIGRGFELDLLAVVMGVDEGRLAKPLAELRDRFVLSQSSTTGRFTFRHALICDTVYHQIPLPERRRLHARISEVAIESGGHRLTDAELSQHLEEAGRRQQAHSAALAAARAASAISSHREAYGLFQRARRNQPPDFTPGDEARLLEELAAAAAATDDQSAAATALEEAHRSYLAAGERARAAAVVGPLVAARHLLGDDLEARVGRLRSALELLDTVDPDPDTERQRATLFASLAAAYMLDRRLEESLVHGERARALSADIGHLPTELDVLATIGSDLVFAGRMDEGWRTLLEATRRGRDAELEAPAARAYRMLASCASVLVEYERGEAWLREGIEYAERVERWNDRHYLASHLAHVLWATGRWDEADRVARHALADGRGGITTRVTALHVLGYLALGRGDWPHAREALQEARSIGERMHELQRISPALWGLAEMALLRGELATARALADAGAEASDRVADAAYLFPFLVTGTRIRLAQGDVEAAQAWVATLSSSLRHRSIPGTLPAIDHAQGLLAMATGGMGEARRALGTARSAWLSLGRAWEGAQAGISLAAVELRTNRALEAVHILTTIRDTTLSLPSPPLTQKVDELLRAARARHPDEQPWTPLTIREWQVARLIAAGNTNVEIARRLEIAPRTVGTHVEHILGKLGDGRRAEIAVWAAGVEGRLSGSVASAARR
jgi:DNA-binding CsgD family transcriptional regulator/tetratricopeptide (TPR) repeat protein